MSRQHTKCYYFPRKQDGEHFEHISTDGAVTLDHLIGETLAIAFCDFETSLELVRFHRPMETLIVQRRLSDIRAMHIIYS